MPVITLPDGSQRTFDNPVTVAEVAASIGANKRTDAGINVCRRMIRTRSEV